MKKYAEYVLGTSLRKFETVECVRSCPRSSVAGACCERGREVGLQTLSGFLKPSPAAEIQTKQTSCLLSNRTPSSPRTSCKAPTRFLWTSLTTMLQFQFLKVCVCVRMCINVMPHARYTLPDFCHDFVPVKTLWIDAILWLLKHL